MNRDLTATAKATKVTYSFHINGNDKDWDTQVGAEIVRNGIVIAQRFDFNHDKKLDHWNNNTDHGPFDLALTQALSGGELPNCTYRITNSPNGHDLWEYNAFLHFEFDDGSIRDFNWPNQSIGKNPESKTYPLN